MKELAQPHGRAAFLGGGLTGKAAFQAAEVPQFRRVG